MSSLVLAHRGLHQQHPENTLAAFAAAVAAGVDGIETDVRLSRDGVALLIHDRVLPHGHAVNALSHAEIDACLGHHVPTLAEALALSSQVLWNVEIKTHAAAPACVEALQPFLDSHQLLISSFHHAVARDVGLALGVPFGFLSASQPLDGLGYLGAPAPAWLVWDCEIVHVHQVREARAAGLKTAVYGARTLEEHEWLRLLGVDAIITDTPACLIGCTAAGLG